MKNILQTLIRVFLLIFLYFLNSQLLIIIQNLFLAHSNSLKVAFGFILTSCMIAVNVYMILQILENNYNNE